MKIWHRRDKKVLIAFFCSIALVFLLLLSTVGRIPPRAVTNIHIGQLRLRIMRYARTHDRLPQTLDELPEVEGGASRIKDGWGKAILYAVNGDGIVTLTSYGKDGAKGGTGRNADMIGVFSPKNKDGVWETESRTWIVDPLDSPRKANQ